MMGGASWPICSHFLLLVLDLLDVLVEFLLTGLELLLPVLHLFLQVQQQTTRQGSTHAERKQGITYSSKQKKTATTLDTRRDDTCCDFIDQHTVHACTPWPQEKHSSTDLTQCSHTHQEHPHPHPHTRCPQEKTQKKCMCSTWWTPQTAQLWAFSSNMDFLPFSSSFNVGMLLFANLYFGGSDGPPKLQKRV